MEPYWLDSVTPRSTKVFFDLKKKKKAALNEEMSSFCWVRRGEKINPGGFEPGSLGYVLVTGTW